MARRKRGNAAILKKITREAKKLLKKHSTWSWKRALKEAGKKFRRRKRR